MSAPPSDCVPLSNTPVSYMVPSSSGSPHIQERMKTRGGTFWRLTLTHTFLMQPICGVWPEGPLGDRVPNGYNVMWLNPTKWTQSMCVTTERTPNRGGRRRVWAGMIRAWYYPQKNSFFPSFHPCCAVLCINVATSTCSASWPCSRPLFWFLVFFTWTIMLYSWPRQRTELSTVPRRADGWRISAPPVADSSSQLTGRDADGCDWLWAAGAGGHLVEI